MKRLLLATFAAVTLLTGCLFPEEFDTVVRINADGSHQVEFSGRVVHALAHKAKIDNGGKMPKGGERAIDEIITKAQRDKDVKSIKKIEDDKADIKYEGKFGSKQSSSLFDVFTVRKSPDGSIWIQTPKLTPNDLKEIKALGLKLDGKVAVYLPSNAEVVSTNATSKPGLIDKSYSWKIKDPQDAPLMVVRLKK